MDKRTHGICGKACRGLRTLFPGASIWAAVAALGAALGAAALAASPLVGQDPQQDLQRRIGESENRLERIRGERDSLRLELERLGGVVENTSAEIANLEAQIEVSAGMLGELNTQVLALRQRAENTNLTVRQTREELVTRKAALDRRLRQIYKRGRLRTVEVLLSSETFSDLLNSYKYLHEMARFDRLLVESVEFLEGVNAAQERALRADLDRIVMLRAQSADAHSELEALGEERYERLQVFAEQQTETERGIERLSQEEAELRVLVGTLEERRLAAEREERLRLAAEAEAVAEADAERFRLAAERATTAGSVTAVSAASSGGRTPVTPTRGNLAWPAQGRLVWRFGIDHSTNPPIPREGVGIGGERGEPVIAVSDGTVGLVMPRTSGYTIVLEHGEGFYTAYQRLLSVAVVEGQWVDREQIIGRIGGETSSPHFEFQLFEPGPEGPRAVDPLPWLEERSAGQERQDGG